MSSTSRARSRFALRLLVTVAIFGFLMFHADWQQVASAVARLPASALLLGFASLLLAMLVGVVRWRFLFVAYGAVQIPPLTRLSRWYFVAMFYNLLPGAVGGDVWRGYETRGCFPGNGTVQALSVVFVERVVGIAGLLTLTALGGLFGSYLPRELLLYSALGLVAMAALLVGLAGARYLSRFLPPKLASIVGALPPLASPRAFILAVASSVLAHVLMTAAGHFLLVSVVPHAQWSESVVVFPLATLAAFFPLTIAGAGARDTALVVLLGRLGVAQSDALACSLALLAGHLLLAAIGSVIRQPGREESVPDSKDATLPQY